MSALSIMRLISTPPGKIEAGQILLEGRDLLQQLPEEMPMPILLITHDLGVVAEMADQVAVMYTGKIVEHTSVEQLFDRAMHPYTRGLLQAVPRLGERKKRLDIIPGMVPDARRLPSGCSFNPRCSLAVDSCREREPALEEMAAGHWVSCWRGDVVKTREADTVAAMMGQERAHGG